MAIPVILTLVLCIAVIAALPVWPYSRKWGFGPSGSASLLLIVLVLLVFMGHV